VRQQMMAPYVISFSAAIRACETGRQWLAALEPLREVRQQMMAPYVTSFSAAIRACETGRQWLASLEQLREVRQQRMSPWFASFSSAISECEKGDNDVGIGAICLTWLLMSSAITLPSAGARQEGSGCWLWRSRSSGVSSGWHHMSSATALPLAYDVSPRQG